MLGAFQVPPAMTPPRTRTRAPTQSRPQLTESSQTNDRDTTLLARTAVSLEYASLIHTGHCPLGIYVIPSSNNLLVWDAVFFVHQGYYADSILKFRLNFPGNYPEAPPTVTFLTDVFHPLIASPSGSFNLAARFRPWRPKEHHAFDILHWIKVAFKKHALDKFTEPDCFNKEAYRLPYHDSTQSFAALATQSATLSQSESALFDLDHPSPLGNVASEIVFKKMTPDGLRQQRMKVGLEDWEDNSTENIASMTKRA
ncbi:UBC-like protein [Crepidotus variabilis]|uniref:UBC-like protein n=1 Tax=Crepidotus variabilis TaxID=179855 RepID=A0A9P6JVU4_9AGAR|nr:UBC-like protein [Crepidotus variabilis]